VAAEAAAPPAISVHKGYKIQASLCVDRLPIEYSEPKYCKEWREFREEWEERTGTKMSVPDEVTFMSYPFQFLLTEEEQRKRRVLVEKTGDETMSELEYLLSQEGLSLSAQAPRKRKAKTKALDASADEAARARELARATVRSLEREGLRHVYLVVKYGSKWMFPLTDRRPNDTMRDTLRRLCAEQLGEGFSPCYVGRCPFTHDKLHYGHGQLGILGRKVFYYRGYHVPGTPNVQPPRDGPVADYAWLTRSELPKYLSEHKMYVAHPGLPLD